MSIEQNERADTFDDLNQTGASEEDQGQGIEARLRAAIDNGDSELISNLTFELLNNSIAQEASVRYRLKEPQLTHFPPGWSFGGLPANWFRTLAGALMSEARRNLHLNQRDFAGLLGLAPSAVSRIESGRQDPSVGNLVRFLERSGYVLRVTLEPIKAI